MRVRLERIALALGVLAMVAFWPTPSESAAPADEVAKSGFVATADGAKIHYLEGGPGAGARSPAMLFVPGWTMSAEIWEKQIAYFSRTRRVVAIDPRSQGLSSQTADGNYPEARARDIKAVADELKLTPVVLVGWSMGVAEVAAYVDQFGCGSLSGLVFVDGMVGVKPEVTLAVLKLAGALERDREKVTAAFVRGMYKTAQSEPYLEKVTQASLQTPTNTAVALMIGMLTGDRQPALGKITKPTLIIGAEGPYSGAYGEMQKSIPGSQLEIFKNVGHALFVDDAERFNRTVDEFIAKLNP